MQKSNLKSLDKDEDQIQNSLYAYLIKFIVRDLSNTSPCMITIKIQKTNFIREQKKIIYIDSKLQIEEYIFPNSKIEGEQYNFELKLEE